MPSAPCGRRSPSSARLSKSTPETPAKVPLSFPRGSALIPGRLWSTQPARCSAMRPTSPRGQMPGFVGVLTGPDHVFEYVNDAYVAISGPRPFIGRTVREVFPELACQGFYKLLERVY